MGTFRLYLKSFRGQKAEGYIFFSGDGKEDAGTGVSLRNGNPEDGKNVLRGFVDNFGVVNPMLSGFVNDVQYMG